MRGEDSDVAGKPCLVKLGLRANVLDLQERIDQVITFIDEANGAL